MHHVRIFLSLNHIDDDGPIFKGDENFLSPSDVIAQCGNAGVKQTAF